MHVDALVAEIGSTTTVVTAFSQLGSPHPLILAQGSHPTTVLEGDVRTGLQGAIEACREALGADNLTWGEMMAASSAAGGLRMSVHGLVYDMTVKAANEAALGAGAVVKMVTAGDLTDSQLRQIEDLRPNILLLAGGVDYGERRTGLENARKIASLDLGVPVIYAGNRACCQEIQEILGQAVSIVENVYPRIDHLNVEPARRAIQEVFERHIIRAPGMEGVRELVSGPILPTPGAVMEAAKLLRQDIGDLMALDIGGATTDVHSVARDSEEIARILIAPEPEAKRTVEGDLGVYINAGNLVEMIGRDRLEQDLGFDPSPVLKTLSAVPESPQEKALVLRLGREAAHRAISRHAGQTRHLYGPTGRMTVAEGKDLTGVKWIVGTGGVLVRLKGGTQILEDLWAKASPFSLLPRNVEVLLDSGYIMAAAGVLSRHWPEAALELLKKSLEADPDQQGSGGVCGE